MHNCKPHWFHLHYKNLGTNLFFIAEVTQIHFLVLSTNSHLLVPNSPSFLSHNSCSYQFRSVSDKTCFLQGTLSQLVNFSFCLNVTQIRFSRTVWTQNSNCLNVTQILNSDFFFPNTLTPHLYRVLYNGRWMFFSIIQSTQIC